MSHVIAPSQRTAQLRVGLIGANWGLTHIDAWRHVPGVKVAAICTSKRSTAEAAAQAHEIDNAYWDADALLGNADLDIIDITPRPSIRAPMALAALRAGRHVIHPLPLALDLAGARELLTAQRGSGKIAMVENLHRHSPEFMQARAMIDAGMLGEVHTIHAGVRTGILLGQASDYPYAWTTQRSSGASALRNFGAHLLHALIWLFGDVSSVAANTRVNLPRVQFTDASSIVNETEDSASLLLQYASGASGTMDVSWCTPAGEGFVIDATGTAGRLILKAEGLGPRRASLAFARAMDKQFANVSIDNSYRLVPDAPHGDTVESLAIMCLRMAAAVRGESARNAAPNYTEAFKVMQIIELAYQAHAQHSWIRVEDHSRAARRTAKRSSAAGQLD
ncbi:MAG: Gfo/Idh/MocA family oxidoreductase [Steroidobacteraceae bacterium]